MTDNLSFPPQDHHFQQMDETLNGYWARDLWNVMECPLLYDGKWKQNAKNLYWENYQNEFIKKEMKYYITQKLLQGHLSLYSVFQSYGSSIHRFAEFTNKQLLHIKSIQDIPKLNLELLWRMYLETLNLQTTHKKKSWKRVKQNENRDAYYDQPSKQVTFINNFYDFYFNFYDERDEFDKDIWDPEKLRIPLLSARSPGKINFTRVPSQLKDLIKTYVKLRLNQQSNSYSTTLGNLTRMTKFLEFINISHPEWRDIRDLSRKDIEQYYQYLRKTPMGGNAKNHVHGGPLSNQNLASHINTLNTFIKTIQKYNWIEAPIIPVHKLIFFEDRPKLDHKVKDNIEHIPDYIWEQVIRHIDQIPKQYVPIILVMEASGFRSCDVVSLTLNCLLETDNGWWLVGDQQKVSYKDHKVPISEEIAQVVAAQMELVKKTFTKKDNPRSLLFPVLKGLRKGQPVSPKTISQNLNVLVQKCDILDGNDELYWFKNHAFRHRYGVALINNGMDITIVQQLMAHTSPEMTAVYAKLLNETKRREWEKARGNGAFSAIRLLQDGNIVQTNLDQQATENGIELEWIRHNFDSIRLNHGFCIKSPKAPCDFLKQSLEPPCIKNNCKSFHVDHTFISFYEDQISKMETDIEIYKKTNRLRSIELTKVKLERYQDILQELRSSKGSFGLKKSRLELTEAERK